MTADLDTLLPASSSDAADIAPLTPADVEAAVRDALAGEEGAADPLDVRACLRVCLCVRVCVCMCVCRGG